MWSFEKWYIGKGAIQKFNGELLKKKLSVVGLFSLTEHFRLRNKGGIGVELF